MPLDLARLAAGVAHVDIPYGDETLAVDYRPERVTGRTFGILSRASAGALDLDALYAELARLLVGWDLTEDGVPVPTDVAGLERLGMTLVGTILQALLADAAASPTRATGARTRGTVATSNGSSPTVFSAPAPTTTTSLRPPGGPTSTPPTSPASPTPGDAYAGVPG